MRSRAGWQRTGSLVVAVAALTMVAGPAMAAGGQQRIDNPWTELDVSHVDGIGPGCPTFVGTLAEDLTGRDVGFMSADGVAHVHTTVQGVVTLTPDGLNAPSYRGSYAMVQTGSYPDEGLGTKVMTRTVNGTLAGSDGTSYSMHETLHLITDGQGRTRADFDHLACT